MTFDQLSPEAQATALLSYTPSIQVTINGVTRTINLESRKLEIDYNPDGTWSKLVWTNGVDTVPALILNESASEEDYDKVAWALRKPNR